MAEEWGEGDSLEGAIVSHITKDEMISKCPFGVFNLPKNQ